jgi:hypothetical protein
MTVFVEWRRPPGLRVTSHVEKLAESTCKRVSRDKLWCGTCHNPHEVPNAARIRARCLNCHDTAACPSKQDDCIGCHMPKNPVVDAQHVVYTDHSIPRPRAPAASVARQDAELVPFGGGPVAPRDQAIPLFERAGAELTALVGLGAIRFERAEYVEELVRTNLALAYWKTGDPPAAEKHLVKAVELSPAWLRRWICWKSCAANANGGLSSESDLPYRLQVCLMDLPQAPWVSGVAY